MESFWSRGHVAGRSSRKIALGGALLIASAYALGAPTVSQVSGALDHNGSITISGSGFGSKPTAAPWVWDNATGSKLTEVWGGAWPNQLPGYNTGYYPPMRGVNPPHSHDSRLIAGAHASNTGANAGYDVMLFKSLTMPSFPMNFYASWYQVADKEWHFGGDNNFKTFDYSVGLDPYAQGGGIGHNWYTAYGTPHPGSPTDGVQWTIENGTPLLNPDVNGHNTWWGAGVNPMGGKWSKVEIAFKATNQNDGWITIWENGRKVVAYRGLTDNYPGKVRTLAVGGYSRMQGFTTNWRYYDDIYMDTTLQRVVLADNSVLANASIVELQIPVAWSDGSITATVNLGKFTQGTSAYVFVVDASGAPSATGYKVTAGGTSSAPSPPSSFQVR